MSEKVRISEDLYEKIKQIAEKSNRTIKDIVEEAIKAYLLGIEQIDKPIKSIQGKIIPLQYQGKCKICGKTISQGELAYWVRYTYTDNTSKGYTICLDCYYKDTSLAEWYLKKRKLESIVRGLQKKADSLAEEIEKLQNEYDVLSLKRDVIQFWRAFKETFTNSPDISIVNQFMDKLNDLIDRVERLEGMLKLLESPIPRKHSRKHEVFENQNFR